MYCIENHFVNYKTQKKLFKIKCRFGYYAQRLLNECLVIF